METIFFNIPDICGFGLHFQLDGFRLVYAVVGTFMWLMAALLSPEYMKHHDHKVRYYIFLWATYLATMGVFLSSDLYTTFIFFEIMSFTSYVWVAQEENAPSLRAAETYLGVAVIGGLVMLMGLFLLYKTIGTLTINEIRDAAALCENKKMIYASACCMLVGFGAKAGAFPLHIWLPKAHPVAPAPASALLSGILTKAGIYGVLILTAQFFLGDNLWGTLILALGTLTMFGGALLAVFSVNLKRTLACSSMSQIGFIMVGIGMLAFLGGEEGVLAAPGAMLHMINHSLIKTVLFLSAGVFYMNTHTLDLSELRGFGRKKPFLMVCFLIGALTIAGVPGLGGYVSKTLLHEAILEYHGGIWFKVVEWTFLFSGGLTVAYMTKLFICLFVEKNADPLVQAKYDAKKTYMNVASAISVGASALVLLVWGIFRHSIMENVGLLGREFMNIEGHSHAVHYFAWENLKGGLISIVIGVLVYLFFIRKFLIKEGRYLNLWPAWWDLEDLLYRPLLLGVLPIMGAFFCRIFDSFLDAIIVTLRKTLFRDSPLPYVHEEGNEMTARMGIILMEIQNLLNKTIRRKNPVYKDWVHLMAVRHEERDAVRSVITRSISFALLMFSLGFSLIMIYMLIIPVIG
ncbi:MAG: sodium:proton antiporter, partial [Lachnospiraceae bacterium]|nr:sodium:proton antiporter [Candidatus Equihabitans merdae]